MTEAVNNQRTICLHVDTSIELATYPYLMKQVTKGADFYVGQQRHVVVDTSTPTDLNSEDAVMIVTLKPASEATP